MRNLLRISDAAVLGIHALAVLGRQEAPVSASRMAAAMGVSEAHLSKVLQRLVRVGMVTSVRGPRGGFLVAREPGEISLLEIFTTIDGPVEEETCFLGTPVCETPDECPVRGLSAQVRELVVGQLGGLTLADIDLSGLLTES